MSDTENTDILPAQFDRVYPLPDWSDSAYWFSVTKRPLPYPIRYGPPAAARVLETTFPGGLAISAVQTVSHDGDLSGVGPFVSLPNASALDGLYLDGAGAPGARAYLRQLASGLPRAIALLEQWEHDPGTYLPGAPDMTDWSAREARHRVNTVHRWGRS